MTDVDFLGYPDGRSTVTLELRRDISPGDPPGPPATGAHPVARAQLRSGMYVSHPDHLAAGEATLCAVYPDARNPWAHPELVADEGLERLVGQTWVMVTGGARPTTAWTSPTRST